jgi:Flp pilus assembly protein TadG
VSGDRGSAAVDFVLVSVLVVLLFGVVFQLGLALHTRNVLVAAAAEGARYGANADRGPAEARARTLRTIAQDLTPAYARRADVAPATVTDGVVEVRVTAPLPLLLRLTGPVEITVTGHALEESR